MIFLVEYQCLQGYLVCPLEVPAQVIGLLVGRAADAASVRSQVLMHGFDVTTHVLGIFQDYVTNSADGIVSELFRSTLLLRVFDGSRT